MRDHGRMHSPRLDVADASAAGPNVADASAPGPDVADASAPGPEGHLHPRVTSFRTRRTTLSGAQQATWQRLWPEIGMHARDADGPAPMLDTEAWFGRTAP